MSRFGLYEGFVMDRNDPEGRARIKVQIPGVLDPISDWIRPIGLFDSANGRGVFFVPRRRANVDVLFLQGDDSRATSVRYLTGPWGKPEGISDVPSEAEGGNPDIVVFAFDGFAIVVDERTGQRKATLLDRENGSYLRFDVETGDVFINAALDFDKQIGQDDLNTVQRDQAVSIARNQDVAVAEDSELTATNRRVATTEDDERTVGRDWKITIFGQANIDCQGNLTIKSAARLKLETDAQTVLQADAPDGDPVLDGARVVKIGRLAQKGVTLDSIAAWLAGHFHDGVQPGSGVSGPPNPVNPLAPVPIPPLHFSQKGKME